MAATLVGETYYPAFQQEHRSFFLESLESQVSFILRILSPVNLTIIFVIMAASAVQVSKNSPTIFFIPGAWHHPWIFDDVRNVLSTRGYETDSATLVTVGSKNASAGVIDDAVEVRSALLKLVEAGKEVILVAHSYGGLVASNSVQGLSADQRSANGKPGGIIMLVFLCAFAVPVGSSLLMAHGDVYPDWWNVTEVNTALIHLIVCSTLIACCLGQICYAYRPEQALLYRCQALSCS